ncbi:hypothetical protein [Chitinophaga sp.]|uniref:hypothetical protein n=1 Tax=Chitinophaga sp. TaxID=1869181 RepID=UPI0025C05033|nr:hypothetical protein [Chitinophaga sp.]
MQGILGKLYEILTQGDATVPSSSDNFFSWCSPGIPITPDELRFLTQGLTGVMTDNSKKDEDGKPIPLSDDDKARLRASDTGKLYMQAENLSRLVDFVPDINAGTNGGLSRLSIHQNEGTLSDVYRYALQFSQVANTELTADEKAKIEKFKQLLQVKRKKKDLITDEETEVLEPSPLVVLYNQKMSAYTDAVVEYNNHRVNALAGNNSEAIHFWSLNADALRNKVKAALFDWETNGYKNEYEGIAARIDQIMSKDLSLLKADYKDALDKAKLTGLASGSDFYYTSLVPGDFVNGGWTTFTFKSADFSSHRDSQFTSYGASASAGFLGFNASGGFQHSDGSTNASFDASNFSLSFQMCQVPIVRPWLKTPFLTSKAWKLDAGNPEVQSRGEFLCDGAMPPKGILPGYPTAILFIRNLKMDFGQYNSQFHADFEKNSASGAAGWGPFTVNANYTHNDSHVNYQSHMDGQGIAVDGMQIIGFNCHMLPKSPNPLPNITSWI